MNRYALLLLAFVFGCFSCGYKVKKLFSDSGELLFEDRYDASCECHRVTDYYPNGNAQRTYAYRQENGHTVLEGDDIVFAEKGDTLIRYFWKDGNPDGRIYCYHPNGRLAYEKFYAHKFKTGTWRYYDENGNVTEEITYEPQQILWNNDADDAVHRYYHKGNLIATEIWKDGRKTKTSIHDQALYREWAVVAKAGATLFKQNCARCHTLTQDLVGPKLVGVSERREKTWLMAMVQNGDSLQKTGDKIAVDLYDTWNYSSHPVFKNLSENEIEAILDYIDNPTDETPKLVDSVMVMSSSSLK